MDVLGELVVVRSVVGFLNERLKNKRLRVWYTVAAW